MAPTPENQHYTTPAGRHNYKVLVCKTVFLLPRWQNSVKVSALQGGLLQIRSYQTLYETRQCSLSHEIGEVEPRSISDILICNVEDKLITVTKGQQVVTVEPRLLAITEPPITHAEIFGIEEKEWNAYKKRIISARNTALIKKYLEDYRNSRMSGDEKPVTADDMDLSAVEGDISTMHPRYGKER